jgi:monothiol glutaredoxin
MTSTMTTNRVLFLAILALTCLRTRAFLPLTTFVSRTMAGSHGVHSLSMADMADDFLQETPDSTQNRIKSLVKEKPVLLFMKGNKLFPQCGFSNTAVQILESFKIDFETVDVLSDDKIREGVKLYSQWPTIPQLYVAGEFIGGSDIMIEMYQSGELGEMIEKAKADMV